MPEKTKQFLIAIKQAHHIKTEQIYQRCLLPLPHIYAVETGGFIDESTAQKVLTVFNQLTGQNVQLKDIHLNLSFDQRYRNLSSK
jgi:hypothetical protein